MKERNIGLLQLDQELQQSEKPVLVVFYAIWCPYCKENVPIAKKILEKNNHEGNFYLIRVENEDDVWMEDGNKKWNLQVVPTYRVYQNQKILWENTGPIQPVSLTKALNKFFD